MTTPQRRRLARWLIAMLVFATLHPAFAAVWAPSRGGQVEVCTSQGMRWVSVPDTAPAGGDAPVVHGEHCPLCKLQGEALPEVARADLSFAPPRAFRPLAAEVPRPFDTAAHRISTAPPRAPPARG